MRILILEDDQNLALDWSEAFSGRGWNASIARNATQAKLAVEHELFDLIVSDMYIVEDGEIVPDGGVTFISMLRTPRQKSDPHHWMSKVPILVVSGSVDQRPGGFSLRDIAIGIGATQALAKPVDPDTIADVAETLLAG
jgi:CheY-like chemotaxis protein